MLLPTRCPVCRRPGPAPCDECWDDIDPAPVLAAPPGVDLCRAVIAYRGTGRELLARLKYRNARGTLPWLAAAMAALAPPGFDTVTWVPTTSQRRQARGFDQSALLARRVAARLGLPCRSLLRREPGPPQTGRSLAQRRRGPVVRASRPSPPNVLLVDDVVTSGATVSTAAMALRRAGAVQVAVLAAARTPPR